MARLGLGDSRHSLMQRAVSRESGVLGTAVLSGNLYDGVVRLVWRCGQVGPDWEGCLKHGRYGPGPPGKPPLDLDSPSPHVQTALLVGVQGEIWIRDSGGLNAWSGSIDGFFMVRIVEHSGWDRPGKPSRHWTSFTLHAIRVPSGHPHTAVCPSVFNRNCCSDTLLVS